MPVFQFNRPTNPLNILGGQGIIPRVGLNFGNSGLGRALGSIGKFFSVDNTKGHPGSAGQVVGQGVRNIGNLFQGRLLGGDSIDAISLKKWKYQESTDEAPKYHPPGFTPPYAFLRTKTGARAKLWKPFEKYGVNIETEITRGNQPMAFKNDQFEKNYILTIPGSLMYRKAVLKLRDLSTQKFTFGLNKNDEQLRIEHSFKTISDNNYETHAGLQSPKSLIPLSSFTSTRDDNEDPTILGFDIVIDELTSPLFNGAILDFIGVFGYADSGSQTITELKSRVKIYMKFLNQFKKFFQTNSISQETPGINEIVKNHYITQITGLEKFSHVKGEESGSEGPKLFTNFPTDKIELLINEDVQQNISYLSYLYNLLTRSRIEGRRIIPQNLLRFNCRIIVSEIRNYNRVVKATKDIVTSVGEGYETEYLVLSDLISKKEYNLYECEFSFNKLTHGNVINMGANLTAVAPITISFNYKFVSSEFHKFEFDPKSTKTQSQNLDGEQVESIQYFTKKRYKDEFLDPMQLRSIDTGRALIQRPADAGLNESISSLTGLSSITFQDPIENQVTIDRYPRLGYPLSDEDKSPLGRAKLAGLANSFLGGLVKNLVGNVVRAGADAINREINSRFNLVNKALNERLSRAGLQVSLNTINNPRNVYNPSNSGNRLRDDLRNAIRGFVGRSVGRFFSSPVNTAEANNGYLPRRQGGLIPLSIYNPTGGRNINRLRASRLNNPRNVYTPRRVSNFLNTTSPTDPRRNSTRFRTAGSNPFTP